VQAFLAMMSHETNTFSSIPTDRRQFEARDLRYGGEILEHFRDTGTCLGGMIAAAARGGLALVPSVAAAASPAARVTRDIFEHVKERMLADLGRSGPFAGVLLDLHGAMVVEGADDGEGDLILAVRQAVGPRVPIAVTLDFHANLSEAMVRGADLLHGYKTYPHVDMAERGVEAAERLLDVVAGRIRPTAAFRKPPILPPLGSQGTAGGPMRRLQDLGVEMERDSRVVSVSIFAGFPHADIPDAGLGVYVVTDGDRALAERLADELAQTAWDHRREFVHRGLPVQDAVARALAAEGRPIVLADMADNTGGGAAGDGTEILRELLRVGARSAVVACLWDPEAVAACVQAGVGSRVTLAVGGKVDDRHGAPLTVTGTVRTLSDGRFVHKGPMLRGLPGRLGPTAVLEVDGVRVILISLRWQTLDPEMLRFVGIEPTEEKIVVVKSTIHYRAAFEPIAREILEVDAPGLSSSNLGRFRFTRIRRPIFPLDPDAAWDRTSPSGGSSFSPAPARTAAPGPELRTARLRLRPFTPADGPAHLALYQDPEVTRHLGGGPFVGAEIEARSSRTVDKFVRHWAEKGFGVFAVEERETGRFLGQCGLNTIDELGEVEVLYALERAAWGRGLATEAARAALAYGFGEAGLSRIVAVTRPDHVRSRRVLEKLGLHYERDVHIFGLAAVLYSAVRP
jgi:microcystin degradation protein MlrC/RimJ/RimL family protein N-acetyltransferase